MELNNVGCRRVLDVNKKEVINKRGSSFPPLLPGGRRPRRPSRRPRRPLRRPRRPLTPSLGQTENEERAALIWTPFLSVEKKGALLLKNDIIREEKRKTAMKF